MEIWNTCEEIFAIMVDCEFVIISRMSIIIINVFSFLVYMLEQQYSSVKFSKVHLYGSLFCRKTFSQRSFSHAPSSSFSAELSVSMFHPLVVDMIRSQWRFHHPLQFDSILLASAIRWLFAFGCKKDNNCC